MKTVLVVFTSILFAIACCSGEEEKTAIVIKGRGLGYSIDQIDWGISKGAKINVVLMNRRVVSSARSKHSMSDGDRKLIVEWALLFRDGHAVAAERKEWKSINFRGDDVEEDNIGEVLFDVETWLSDGEKMTLDDGEAQAEFDSIIKHLGEFLKQVDPEKEPQRPSGEK